MTNHGNPTHSAAFQTPRAARGHNRQGFTLIELMVACLLLALLAAVIGWSVRGPILASRLTQTVERIRHADRLAREMARRGGGDVRLTFDAGDGRITLQRAGRTVRQTGLPATRHLAGSLCRDSPARSSNHEPRSLSMQCCDCDTAAARRRAFTLVEVVVGTVLLAAFAGSTFLAFRVHNLQLRNAGDTLAAVNFADQKLESLLAVPRPFGKADGGSVPGHPTWRWSLRSNFWQRLWFSRCCCLCWSAWLVPAACSPPARRI